MSLKVYIIFNFFPTSSEVVESVVVECGPIQLIMWNFLVKLQCFITFMNSSRCGSVLGVALIIGVCCCLQSIRDVAIYKVCCCCSVQGVLFAWGV